MKSKFDVINWFSMANCCKYFLGVQETDTGEKIFGYGVLKDLSTSPILEIKWVKEDGTFHTGEVQIINYGYHAQEYGCCYTVGIMCATDGDAPVFVFTKKTPNLTDLGIFIYTFDRDGNPFEDGYSSCSGHVYNAIVNVATNDLQSTGYRKYTVTIPGISPTNFYVFTFEPTTSFPTSILISAYVQATDTICVFVDNKTSLANAAFSFTLKAKKI